MPKRTDIKKVLVKMCIRDRCVLIGGLAGSEEVDSGIRSHGPVVVLARTVDSGERLLVAVSYTHLDVYKRQVQDTLAGTNWFIHQNTAHSV